MSVSARLLAVASVLTLGWSLPAQADVPGKILFGLNQLGYQSQITRNFLGDGYEFQSVAPYSGRTFHLGLADLSLGRNSPATVQLTSGYTTRFLPEAHFSLTTLGAPLGYTFDFNNGIQDFVATGTVRFDITTRINALGFYDKTVQISNRGTYSTDGFGPTEGGSLDSDIGPINISGNIYADIAAILTQPFFDATGTENPFAKFSLEATKIAGDVETVTDLMAQASTSLALGGDDVGKLVNNGILSALLGKSLPTSKLFDDMVIPAPLLKELMANESSMRQRFAYTTPEPTSVALLALGGALCLLPLRRARHVQS